MPTPVKRVVRLSERDRVRERDISPRSQWWREFAWVPFEQRYLQNYLAETVLHHWHRLRYRKPVVVGQHGEAALLRRAGRHEIVWPTLAGGNREKRRMN
jgi:hypothetical protein